MLKHKDYKVLNVAHTGFDSVGILEHAGSGEACCDEHLAPNEGFWVVGEEGENVNHGSDIEAAFEDYLRRVIGNAVKLTPGLEGFFVPESSSRIIAKVLFEKFLEHEIKY
jgi:hypothetical protein